MDFHLLVGAGSVAQNAVNTAVPLITDSYYTNIGTGYMIGDSKRVQAAYVRADSASSARLNSPELRLFGPPQLYPVDTAALPPNLPPYIVYRGNGPNLAGNSPFNVEVSRAGAGAAQCNYALWLSSQPPTPYRGTSITIPFSAAVTLALGSWTQYSPILGITLPTGRYAIVGMVAYGTGMLFNRMIFPSQANRPGVLCLAAYSNYPWDDFRNGNMGYWGEFSSIALPVMEAIGSAAGATTVNGLLDLVRIGNA